MKNSNEALTSKSNRNVTHSLRYGDKKRTFFASQNMYGMWKSHRCDAWKYSHYCYRLVASKHTAWILNLVDLLRFSLAATTIKAKLCTKITRASCAHEATVLFSFFSRSQMQKNVLWHKSISWIDIDIENWRPDRMRNGMTKKWRGEEKKNYL